MLSSLEILKKYWGYPGFRPLQEDIISSALARKDTLALMPTGGGKSICFQVPGLQEEGVSIVITPLIALMKDQVKQLRDRGIRAAAIYSGMHHNDIDRTLDNFVLGDYKFLYVSPERLLTEMMIERTKLMNVRFLVVDEAHCISKWGHDFRPSYLKIKEFRQFCPKASVIALTATATEITQKDIIKKLELKEPVVLKMSFKRNNLAIFCTETTTKARAIAQVLQDKKESAIVYVKTRKQTQETAHFLKKCGVSSDFYHAGLTNELRSERQDAWINNETQVIVSTNAFGMGIDKADVRYVFHLHIPQNMEAYYQEIGRAGRDGKPSEVYLFYSQVDIEALQLQLEQRYPAVEMLRKTYQSLCNYYKLAYGSNPQDRFDFDLNDFITVFGLKAIPTHFALKLLESQGIIELSDSYMAPSTLKFTVSNTELYKWQLKNETLEAFTKTLLRIYGGEIFTDFCMISETEIARAYHSPASTVVKLLDRLHQLKIIHYRKQISKPGIHFLGNRFDAQKLPLNFKEIKAKKAQDESSVNLMIDYVQSKRRCRMAQLQDFFGEENAENCGICDHCKTKAKEEIVVDKIIRIGKEMELQFPASLSDLEKTFKGEVELEYVVHFFIDHGEWHLSDGKLLKAN
ncbi:ATP-dependent DNA helicase RecQ [Jiulongibacter sediminis]|uniref:RecQ family ATP-dependent DNA helicase n=1 Tax=Jiulongibacter sediminis TaxID=1605367 RepID=UPI0026EE026E|nr:ATP-dependent DNA helicase RecQ [Jiulongibacter sediminis]